MPTHQVGEAVHYRHSDAESLAAFLATFQQDLQISIKESATDLRSPQEASLTPLVKTTAAASSSFDTTSEPGTIRTAATDQPPSSTPTVDGDGYIVVRRRAHNGTHGHQQAPGHTEAGEHLNVSASTTIKVQRSAASSRRAGEATAKDGGTSQVHPQQRPRDKR
ncbi:hypothetical protein PF005_g13184 [Phytophthora fragariae]|uniref:Uncharacterized protein n=1 Tax=Phytophthora fragariae TaxID=53985 RepID=A0A6A3XZM2_9STRA|nr:hypothetical protein PF003_g36790 [Phytophthora fragariae]KAE8935667.1 hypothetical protein PF009_g14385 [Phytophthora fragariae]KAE9205981.1 hypothetical protein PF005_g13184 [Phytophthora fragariae]KAE9224714.1 hypothetical protein PF002_g14613 [Phytophthora fragariae]